ncbi:MAG: putative secreted esterase [Frankiales bacterium]|nr:putative secreted esterase [Frankiales bacterium]
MVAGVVATVLLPLAWTTTAASAVDSPGCVPRQSKPSVGLTLVSTRKLDARTYIYAFRSAAVGTGATPAGLVHVRVIVPQQYLSARTRRFPVLYYTHGTGSNAESLNLAEVEKDVLGTTPVVFVTPDGGSTSFYADHYGTSQAAVPSTTGAVAAPPAWETFFNRELVPWIDQHFRTTGHRSISGESMGGYGSMAYAALHPRLYDAALAVSGAVDIEMPGAGEVITAAYGNCIFGDPVTQAANWHAKNPTALAAHLRGISLFVTSGNGLPGRHDDAGTAGNGALEVLLNQMNKNFVAALGAAHVPVRTWFYGNGTHPFESVPNASRFYIYDAMRCFLPQAMTAMGASGYTRTTAGCPPTVTP